MFFASHKIGAAQYLGGYDPKHVRMWRSSLQPRSQEVLKTGRGNLVLKGNVSATASAIAALLGKHCDARQWAGGPRPCI
jgi:hypothetical protein